jgi:intracellular sulfur oxidation DsrE/DsrF family protein
MITSRVLFTAAHRLSVAVLIASSLAAAAHAQSGPPSNKEALQGVKEMKIAFDITTGNPKSLLGRLEVIDLTRKQLIADGVEPRFVIAMRGDASYFAQSDLSALKPEDRAMGEKIAAKLKELRGAQGVDSLVQCAVSLPPRKLTPEGVMSDVKVVGNGWITLVSYQQKGYSYIVP